MLYLAIPAHNEDATIGVLLWRLRTVLAEFPREYEVVVYDDASTDETAAVASQYVHAMPVTVLRGTTPVGYAGAVDALVRHIAGHTRYPRRDAMLLLQGDFTDPPGIVPEFARRFEGGADLVVGERTAVVDAPVPVRRLFTAAGWALKPFVRVDGLRDLTGSMRLVRISALRDLLRAVGDRPVCAGDSWTANADLLLQLVPHARRIETVPVEPTYGVRTRETRRVTVRDALAALRWGWRARNRRPVPMSAAEVATEPARGSRPTPPASRREDTDVTAERLRERARERDRARPEVAPPGKRDGKPDRERTARADERKPRRAEGGEPTRPPRGEDDRSRPARPAGERKDKQERQPRRDRSGAPDQDLVAAAFDDPFAGPASRERPLTPTPAPQTKGTSRPDAPAARAPSVAGSTGAPPAPAALAPMPSSALDDTPSTVRDAHDVDRANVDRANVDGRDVDGNDPTAVLDATHEIAPGADGATNDIGAGDVQERKRRRNRRSRRRKSRSGSESNESTDAATDGSAGDSPYAEDDDREDGEEADREARSDRGDRGDHGDRANADDDAIGTAGRDGDELSEDDFEDRVSGTSRETRSRKRRRGRRKRGDRLGESLAASNETADNTDSGEPTDERPSGRRGRGPVTDTDAAPADSRDEESRDGDASFDQSSDGPQDRDASDSDAGDSDEGREARARRRGRRGRRGGARRARGRGREPGDTEGPAGADDGPSSDGAPE